MISNIQNYDDFFNLAFGQPPFDRPPFAYQRRIATEAEMPTLINAPTGAGKTAAILGAWLWRRLKNPQSVGRRLVYCLPMRTLVDQTAKVARTAIKNLAAEYEELEKKKIEVHVLMGGEVAVDWDALPEREAIIIGTQDMLLSRALNRGYALNTARYPLPFGLLNNDCLFVFDEIQLMGDALATSAQLAAFRQTLGAFGVQQSVWMSATLDKKWLETIDFKEQAEKLEELKLNEDDRAIPALHERLHAVKRIEPAPSSCRMPNRLAGFVKERHTRGTQTLVVVNRVARAREVFAALENEYGLRAGKRNKKTPTQEVSAQAASVSGAASVPQLELIHSRFRPADRKRWDQIFDGELDIQGAGRIIVATQVVEAGLDISSRMLVTDIAPYSSLVQRFGRCNRKGEEKDAGADIFWIDRPLLSKEEKLAAKGLLDDKERAQIARPYPLEQVDKARELLAAITSAAPADLPIYSDEVNYEYVLRRRDIVDLFDTTTDLSGYDLDISRFVRGGDERDVYVAWREFKEGEGEPNALTSRPAQRELCPVRIGELKEFLKKSTDKQPRIAWRWNPLLGKPLTKKQREKDDVASKPHGWEKIGAEELRPGLTVLLDSRAGGYTPERGWDGETNSPVPEVPLEQVEQQPATDIGDEPLSENAANAIALSREETTTRRPRYLQTLRAHSTEARQKMKEILDALGNPQLDEFREDLLAAALHHDWGKAHEVFQDTMQRGARGVLAEGQLPNEMLAKTFNKGFKHSRKHFRHELASALALLASGENDLRVYLAAAHHGKVRLSLRALPNEDRPSGEQNEDRKYARGIWDGDKLESVRLSDDVEREAVTLDLEPMLLGSADGEASWLERMIRLRDDESLGVFRLTYLECLIRAADMRASAYPVNCITEPNSTQDICTENDA
jgi:CRISPR-associated endonuclease/helicase Cas3